MTCSHNIRGQIIYTRLVSSVLFPTFNIRIVYSFGKYFSSVSYIQGTGLGGIHFFGGGYIWICGLSVRSHWHINFVSLCVSLTYL